MSGATSSAGGRASSGDGPVTTAERVPEGPVRAARPRRRAHPFLLGAAAVLVAFVVWWFATPHPAMFLSGTGDIGLCATRITADDRDFVTGNVTFTAPRDVQVLSVRLVDPVNVTLADARIAPTVPQPDGGGVIPGLSRGWPLTVSDRADLTLDWSSERDLDGAHLTAGVTEAPILHVQVVDPSQDASFRAWEVEYRMAGTRWVSRFTHAFAISGTVGVNACDQG
ncbi:hypothetical protein OEB99_16790 [Actinotalea sp. M2MS4P-6]|uniref:hypothetical protein n=1 Tax=Actinotalea sp. M2MS4P-6 TaxID=2983762 RepID=UPI0021E45FB0|nr:hypothetical protein [Actinotalea sp. M2MS4P-6]MCV2395974.1 hypothetical protein [Actinotalea sp. M2MS4P-6]